MNPTSANPYLALIGAPGPLYNPRGLIPTGVQSPGSAAPTPALRTDSRPLYALDPELIAESQRLLAAASSAVAADPPATSSQHQPSVDILAVSDDEDDDEPGFSSSSPPSSPVKSPRKGSHHKERHHGQGKSSKRVTASRGNPRFGLVDGARIGRDKYLLHRSSKLRHVSFPGSKGAARFKRLFHTIIRKAEQTAHETRGWIYIIGQHPNANHGFLQYSSPRLGLDGGPRLDQSHRSMGALFHGLQAARRVEVTQLASNLAEKEAEIADLQKRLRSAERRLQTSETA